MPKKATKAFNGTKTVTRTVNKEESEEVTDLEVQVFDPDCEVATVSAGYGITVNLGNYQSAKADVRFTLPCYPEEVEETAKKIWRLAKEELSAQKSFLLKGRK